MISKMCLLYASLYLAMVKFLNHSPYLMSLEKDEEKWHENANRFILQLINKRKWTPIKGNSIQECMLVGQKNGLAQGACTGLEK